MKISAKQYSIVLLDCLEGKDEKQAGEIIKKFSEVLFANNHLSKADSITRFIKEAWDKKYGEVEAEIITARPVSREAISELEKFIKTRAASEKIAVKSGIAKNILGGAILRYGDKSLDLSLKTKLANLKRQITN